MRKRFLAVLATLCLALPLLTVGVSAANIVDSGECGDNVTWTLDSDGLLTISGTGAMLSHEGFGWYPWFVHHTEIRRLEIENGVTSIGDYAFANYSLEQINISESVTTIGIGAFEFSCPESFYIPGTVSDIGKLAFGSSSRLEHITIGNGATTIPDEAFRGCWSLSNITIPISVTSIGSGAFMGCDKLTDVYYDGTEAQWHAIKFAEDDNLLHNNPHDWYSNDPLFAATIHYNGDVSMTPQSKASPSENMVSKFEDIKETDIFYDSVKWAVENKITTGTGETTFSPAMTVTRAQAMTFLWRLAGMPEPETADTPFSDVKESDWFYKPVLWAVENGITTGTSATAFSPDLTCSHAHMVTFLMRTAQEEYLVEETKGAWWTRGLAWEESTGIKEYFSDLFDVDIVDAISAEQDCTRANTVGYLYAFDAIYGSDIQMLYAE